MASRPLLFRVSFGAPWFVFASGVAMAPGSLSLDWYTRCGSLADMLLPNLGSSLRTEVDLEPERGVCSVLLDEPPPPSLRRIPDDRLTAGSPPTGIDLCRP